MSDTLVLCYHAVSPRWDADLSVTPDALRAQLDALRRAGYRGVTFAEAVHTPHRGNRVAVTFDDAFLSVLTLAKPVLDDLGWPATVFAVADCVRDGTPLAWDGTDHWLEGEHAAELTGMDAAQLTGLDAGGWEIGSHTCTHPHLTQLGDEPLREELTRSKALLEELLGRPVESLAYPYGDHDARVVEATRAAGYRRACTLPARWPRPETLMWPRVGLYHPDDQRRFRVKTSRAVRRARQAVGR